MAEAEGTVTETAQVLEEHRAVWDAKPVLRTVYNELRDRMVAELVDGPTLEVGAGSGHLDYGRFVIRVDILPSRWIDVRCDGQDLPFADETFDNVLMMDVLHHIDRPGVFLREVSRVVRPGGRIVMVEPYISVLSYPFYKFIHEEPVDLRMDPLEGVGVGVRTEAFDSNQAIPTRLFMSEKGRRRLERDIPALRVRHVESVSVLAYPLSGGFQTWSLITDRVAGWLLRLEARLPSVVRRLVAFRCLVSIERVSTGAHPGSRSV